MLWYWFCHYKMFDLLSFFNVSVFLDMEHGLLDKIYLQTLTSLSITAVNSDLEEMMFNFLMAILKNFSCKKKTRLLCWFCIFLECSAVFCNLIVCFHFLCRFIYFLVYSCCTPRFRVIYLLPNQITMNAFCHVLVLCFKA